MTRTALVTGGCSGIGLAAANRLRADGIRVLTADLAPDADVAVDVSSAKDVADAAGSIGAVDILVNSAGIVGPNAPLWEITDEQWDRVIRVDLTGVFNCCRAVIPGMIERGWGRIVNVASIAGKEGNPNLSAYSAAKAGVIGLTKSLGKELATSGVLVHAIAPAVISTPMNAGTAPETLRYMIDRIPMGRLGEPDEVAELIAWLCSDRCTFSTGSVHDISGGRATY
ncbi:SDR family NAD(P)-dependent oxidoreductase [Kribbella solani]|uniref:3-oxoacyl-[acyl-carrier protein] reductase n=1 Tax=Kribbella solani TaxID=236067 RepID=A0A841E1Q3_9ACTN|nr:SDR family NAD(P)-dependent oxidoreductase [Kribbella solani]MBB5982890.1 3-oxoacyl-[acyl-carrier protein] reductase [Kribbella solani]MDX3000836.1 SDR family NAD(P)-dependent oxidoreductase [Kribbella solani]